MRSFFLPLLAIFMALSANAATPAASAGETSDAGSIAPAAKMTKEDREKARAERKKTTAAQSKEGKISHGEADSSQSAAATQPVKATKEERDAARAARLKKTAAEAKAGQISKGEAQ